MITDWIVAASSVVASMGIVFVAIQANISVRQLKLQRDQLAADHERSRRERALEVLWNWSTSVTISQPSARVLVESFSHEQCEKLVSNIEFKISGEKQKQLGAALSSFDDFDLPEIEDGQILLTKDHLFRIRYQCTSFLNSLEITLQAWHLNVADQAILEHELRYLVKPEKRYYVLQELRNVLGGTGAYPAIQAFVDHLKKKHGSESGRDRIA